MRICLDNPEDKDFDPRPRRVWSNDIEVSEPWSLADEFRRVVILASGKVLNGAVFVERLKDTGESEGLPTRGVNTGFSGTAVHVKDKTLSADDFKIVPRVEAAPAIPSIPSIPGKAKRK